MYFNLPNLGQNSKKTDKISKAQDKALILLQNYLMALGRIYKNDDISIFSQEGRHKDESLHSHKEHQILFSYKDSFNLTIENEEITIPPLKAIFIPSGVKHSFNAKRNDSLQYFLLINQEYWVRSKKHFKLDLDDTNYLKFSSSNYTKQIMDDILLSPNTIYQKAVTDIFIAKLIQELINQKNHSMLKLKTNDPELKKVLQYINKNFKEKISNQEMAIKFGMTERNLTRKFKKEFGLTIKQYQLQLKIEKANEMIASEKYNLTDIAFHLGFSSLSHFLETYKEKTSHKARS